MLNKEICRKCCIQWHQSHKPPYKYEVWTSFDNFEKRWAEEKYAPCVDRFGGMLFHVSIGYEPPHACIYAMEHLVCEDVCHA